MTDFDRRQLFAGLAALGLAPRARSPRCFILIWLDGGMSHLDTFDAKPEAGAHIRGDLASIRANLDGVLVSAHLPQLAARLDRCALLRSLSHGEGNHDRGAHLLLTGKRPSPVAVAPCLPAILAHQSGELALPQFVAIPDAPEFGHAGFLPAASGPFELGGNPGNADFAVRDLGARDGDAGALALLDRLDALDGAPRSAAERDRDRFLRQARSMSRDPEVARAFDLRAEPAERRERYGRHRLGQGCLLAHRLVRAGVRSVLVRDIGWDHHVKIARELTYGFPPKLVALDQALSALLDDLDGGDGEVVVCLASEFGRTPRLNPQGGRDHWPRAQSVLLYGGGIRRGVVHGSTDANGEEPRDGAVSAADLFATLAQALNLPRDLVLRTPEGRPVRAVEEGARPIAGLLA